MDDREIFPTSDKLHSAWPLPLRKILSAFISSTKRGNIWSVDRFAQRAPDICTRERTNTFDKFRSAGIQRDCLSPSAKEINKLTDRWRVREIERKRALRVNGPSTTGETTTGIRPWTTNSLINQIPVCRTNGRANIEQPVSGTPRGIKVQGISEKRFFSAGPLPLFPSPPPPLPPVVACPPACRRNDFRRAVAGAALWREICTLQRVARRNYSLIIRAYRACRARERISSLPRVNTRLRSNLPCGAMTKAVTMRGASSIALIAM